MRKINFIFASVFAAAMIAGVVNVFVAVDVAKPVAGAVGKGGIDTGDKKSTGLIGQNGINVVERCGVDVIGKLGIDTANAIDAIDRVAVSVVRKGRRIQVDGFLLEWRGASANVWPGSDWRWDAVSTADGVAGYVSLPSGVGVGAGDGDKVNNVFDDDSAGRAMRSDLLVTLCAVNTGKSLEIRLPGRPVGEYFAFDRGAFDADGTLTAEWIVPWDYFKGGADTVSAYELALVAGDAAVGLRYALLTVAVPAEPRASGGLLTRLAMPALIAALTVALVVIRRRRPGGPFPPKRL